MTFDKIGAKIEVKNRDKGVEFIINFK